MKFVMKTQERCQLMLPENAARRKSCASRAEGCATLLGKSGAH